MDPTGGIRAGDPYQGIRRRQPAEPRPAGERRPEQVVRRPARGGPARPRLGFLQFVGRTLTAYLPPRPHTGPGPRRGSSPKTQCRK